MRGADCHDGFGHRGFIMHYAPNPEHSTVIRLIVSSSNSGAMAAGAQNLVGPQVRRLRMAADLSQEALAVRLQMAGWDLSRAGLSKIEARLRRVNDAELWVMAEALSCAIADLYPPRPCGVGAVLRQGCG